MKLFYKKYGEKGKPIFILHGIFGMLDNWHLIAKALSNHFTIYSIDARNHGQSPHSNQMSYELMASDIFELADDLGIDRFILMGHSMGGKTAMHAAMKTPKRIDRLIVVDISPFEYKPGHLRYFKAFREIPWDKLQNRNEVDQALIAYEESAGIRLFLAKNIERAEEGFRVRCNIDALEASYTEIIGGIQLDHQFSGRVYFILGADSDYVKEDDKGEILRYFPSSEFFSITSAGHWVHADNPSGFLECIESLLLDN